MIAPRLRHFPLLLASVLLTGCATYSATMGEMERQLAVGNPRAALEALEQRGAPERDRALFLLDKAMLLRLAGDYAASNAAFEEAKTVMEVASVASVTETTGSFIINDATRSYAGEPFEQALLHAYAALNYLALNAMDEARVEALQVDARLQALADDDDEPLAQDPFARYLAGVIYEAKGESDDALISYRKAYQAYKAHTKVYGAVVPAALQRDLLRLTERLGLKDEHARLKEEFKREDWPARAGYAQNGELVFLLHNGLAPVKREHISVIYPPVSSQVVSVALPYYEERSNPVARARLTAGDAAVETELVEDINAIAKATLDDAMGAITARAVARAVAKYKVTAQAKKENAAAGLVSNIAGLLTERADTRSWLTLPGEVQLARLLLPPGDHRLKLELLTAGGAVLATREFDVHIEKGRKSFLSHHWIPSLPAGRI